MALAQGQKYELLKDEATQLSVYSDDQHSDAHWVQAPQSQRRNILAWILSGLLSASIAVNVFLALHLRGGLSLEKCTTDFAGLSFDQPVPWHMNTSYGNYAELGPYNATLADELWEGYQVGVGEVALSNSYADAKGLPRAIEFPWDEDSGIYLLNGYHSLHCLKKIRRTVEIYNRSGTQQDEHDHILHCLDKLRQDVLCYADDTPMYFSEVGKAGTGEGQVRMCRDWNRLEAWAVENSACYLHLNETTGATSVMDKYKYCPPGSPYTAKARDFFNLTDEFFQQPFPVESVPPY